MRAKEFIIEQDGLNGHRGTSRSPASHEFDRAHPGMIAPAGRGDLYIGRYYDFYRVSQLVGMDPEELKKVDEISFFGNLPLYSAYTKEEAEKLTNVMKKLGMKPKNYTNGGSCETDGTNSISPIKSFKGYE